MHRLKRHIVTEIGEVFFAVIITLILIMLSFQFVMLLNQAANGKIVGAAIFKLLSLHAVNLFVELTPFAFFIACLITLTRLAGDRELIAMQSLGMGIKGLYQAIFYITLPLALFVLYLTLFMLPTTLSLYQQLTQQAKKKANCRFYNPAVFVISVKTPPFLSLPLMRTMPFHGFLFGNAMPIVNRLPWHYPVNKLKKTVNATSN